MENGQRGDKVGRCWLRQRLRDQSLQPGIGLYASHCVPLSSLSPAADAKAKRKMIDEAEPPCLPPVPSKSL